MKRKLILISADIICYLIACTILIIIFPANTLKINIFMRLTHTISITFTAILVRIIFGIYRRVWRYASSHEFLRMLFADIFAGIIYVSIDFILLSENMLSLVHLIAVFTFACLATIAMRFVYKILHDRNRLANSLDISNRIKVAIVGAGSIGVSLAEDLKNNPSSKYYPILFIDNNSDKIGKIVNNMKIIPEDKNTFDKLSDLGIQEIVIAMPGVSPEIKKHIFEFYKNSTYEIKNYDYPILNNGNANENGRLRLRDLKIEDLLFRDSRSFENENVKNYYKEKVILITGGGGSIGSELCRQIAKASPKKLIILDIYENSAYNIQQELINKFGSKIKLFVEIASVCDKNMIDYIFNKYKPDIVFHAAAHKHVPLMEHNPTEAIINNIFGTNNVIEAADKHAVKRFIMISTDKAVNPTNVMGATKRMCEMIVQSKNDFSKTDFIATRFGNVLGSNGSVIPLFKRQIENGGPITITDKRIIRYFMTIPEAAQLVLTCGSIAKKGELFVLDMGKPVKIIELAENMIRLSGFTPYEEIKIEEIGLRPGEKLYEELLIKSEHMKKTENNMIFIEKDLPLTSEIVEEKLKKLHNAVNNHKENNAYNVELIKSVLMEVVPSYHNPDEVNPECLNVIQKD